MSQVLPLASYDDVEFVRKLYYLLHLVNNCSIFSLIKKMFVFLLNADEFCGQPDLVLVRI
jgi:hypothetical protein